MMTDLLSILNPELVLAGFACLLFFMGMSGQRAMRRAAPFVAMAALVAALAMQWHAGRPEQPLVDSLTGSVRIDAFAYYIRILTGAIAVILLLLAWPTNAEQTGNSALHFGEEAGEFFALFLLSTAGLMLTAIANDLIVLFLALELVSIPTYVMVAMSRPNLLAQEAGVKYFFLGAMSVAIMLFGFSYLYGVTGQVNLTKIGESLQAATRQNGTLPSWHLFAVLMVLIGFTYKMASFPLHFYAGDVYEGAATPVTAFLAFVPKTAGFVALVKLLLAVGGDGFVLPERLVSLLWVMAVLTMFVGNVLALLQNNVKRVLAYSSIAHSGYMLAGAAALAGAGQQAIQGILFYLAAYGVMNSAAFGVLMLLPSRQGYESAETFDDLAGQGRQHVALGLAMTVTCFSLIGIPLTVGFLGKLMLIRPALTAEMYWLVVLIVVNAAISAAYYLRIVASLFLRPEPVSLEMPSGDVAPLQSIQTRPRQWPVMGAVAMSVILTLTLGSIPQAAQGLTDQAKISAEVAQAARLPSVP